MSLKVYVGNLPRNLTRETLLAHFDGLRNEILKIDLGIDREGRFNGYCYLTVEDQFLANKLCQKYHHSVLEGNSLRVTISLQRHHLHDFDNEECFAMA